MKTVVALLAATLLASSALAANVEGFVYGVDGTPIDGATITAYTPEGSAEQLARLQKRAPRTALATTKSEAGRFTLSNLPDSIIDVDVRAEGFAPAAARTLVDDVPVTISLTPARLVDGRVTAQRKPLANAYVVWLGAHDVEYSATTDDNGRYRVPDPQRWAREPRVIHPTHSLLPDSGRGGGAADIDIPPPSRVDPPAKGTATLSGTVRLGNKPLAGAPLTVQSGGERYFPPVRVVTDAKGRYTLSGLPETHTFVGGGEGLEPRIRTRSGGNEGDGNVYSAELQREKSATLDLTFSKAPMITGRVVDADNKPVAAASVQIVLAGRSTFDFGREQSAHTLADGRYAIPMPPFQSTETANVAVTPRNHSTVRSQPFTSGAADHRIDITLPRFSAITLRVVDPEKKPVPNALVAFAATDDLFNYSDARMLLNEPFVARAMKTNEAGETVIHVVPGMYDFAAKADGFQIASAPQKTLSRPMTLELPLEQAFAIRGRVHRNDTGVAGVEVRVAGSERMFREMTATTNSDGTFAIDGLAREKYRIVLQKYDELIQKTLDVNAPANVDVPLPPAGLLRARVIDAATRQPVTEFIYTIEPLDTPADPRYGGGLLQNGISTPDGIFTATLGAAAYRVYASATGYTVSDPIEVRLTEREPTDVQLLLDRGVTISGRVVDENGAPLAEAQIFASGSEGDRWKRSVPAPGAAPGNGRSGEDGTYSISGLEPGTISLTGRKEGFVPFRKALEVTSATTFDVQLSRGLRIEGTVTRGGKPVVGAQIGATTAAVGGDHQPAVTDRNGRFTLQGLIAARYTISAYHDEMHTEVRDVDPSTQRQLAISLDPKPRGVIFGTVTGLPSAASKVVRRAVFAQTDDRGAEAIIDEAGNYRIEDAPTGSVKVSAQWESTAGGRMSPVVTVNVAPGQEVRADLDLGSTTSVSGRVSHEGRALAGARVVFTTQSGLGASSQTRSDGTYDVALPSPGTYQIFAHADTMNAQPYQSVRAIRGGETIDIELREQQIEGTVIDAETRLPVAGAVVTLVPETMLMEALSGETITDANGRFRILTAAAGPHRALAWSSGYAHATQSVTLGSSSSRQLAFELRRTGELRVRVVDSRNNTPLEAHVVVTTAEGGFIPVRPDRAADGETYVFSLADGSYRVQAIVHGYATKAVTVSAPGAIEIRME